MCVNKDIIKRQWHNRNHDVFGSIARRQIRGAIRRLRDERANHIFSSRDQLERTVKYLCDRDEVASVICTDDSDSCVFRIMINRKGYGYCRLLSPCGKPVGDALRVKASWIREFVFNRYYAVMEVN